MAPEIATKDACQQEERRPPVQAWNNKVTALVVDYVNFCRMLMRTYLSCYGVETVTAVEGTEAIEIIQDGDSFDLIVIDMHMSGMSGIECIRRLRDMGVTSRIVGTTSTYGADREREFHDAGGDDFIEKPFSPSKFVPILQEIDNQF